MTPVVIVHGAGLDAPAYAPLARALDGLCVHSPSLPGRGAVRSAPLDNAAAAAAWLGEWLDENGVGPAVFVGHSYGGAVAIELALAAPDRVAGLVLVSTGARLRVHSMILGALDVAVAKDRWFAFARVAARPRTDPGLIAELDVVSRSVAATTAWSDWQATNAFDRMADVGRVQAPTIVAVGAADPLTPPKYSQYLAEQIPNAELVIVPDGGHLLPIERADEIGALARRLAGG